jgi:hypothetical protein
VQDDRAVGAATVAVRREEAHVPQPQHCRDVPHGGRLDVVQAEPVDVVEAEAGVVERGADRDRGHLGLAHSELPGERGLPDADDGGGAWLHGSVRLDAAG